MTNQEIIELSKIITNVLYIFLFFMSGVFVGYVFGRNDENDF
jgi:hypothetical protein